jgi:hypothetical protein
MQIQAAPIEAIPAIATPVAAEPMVRHFRQIVLWPLQVVCSDAKARHKGYDARLGELAPGLWRLVDDEFGNPDTPVEERHYREFVSFLPHVQRFLYGDGAGPTQKLGRNAAPLRIYRRHDVARVRMVLQPGSAPITCGVAHIDLCFFHEVDTIVLAFELHADELPLSVAQDIIYRFGRAYPPGWTEAGEPMHCPAQVEWLDASGVVLAASNYEVRGEFLSFVGERRAPNIARHWEYLLHPLVPSAKSNKAELQFRQVEYYRMPVMAYMVLDALSAIGPPDYVRLALAAGPGERGTMPYADRFLADFETRYCYDRFHHGGARPDLVDTRFLCCGHAFVVIAGGDRAFLLDGERGLLGQFRHQLFLLFMLAHFHKASLLMLSDRLVAATKLLDPGTRAGPRRFREEMFGLQEKYIMFSQRYYFSEVSDQVHARDLFRMMRSHLVTEELYEEVRSELGELVQYLDSSLLRRQSASMHRLTTVTILGLIVTTATGFLGMNIIAAADLPLEQKVYWFGVTVMACAALTLATVAASRVITWVFDRVTGEH